MPSVAARRLAAHRLVGRPFRSAVDAVRAFGALQAQDYAGASWGLGQRVDGATAAGLGRLFDRGALLRTHVLRPTWHLVLPEDIGWMLSLTAPRLRARLAGRRRQLGLDEATISRAGAAFEAALADGQARTRDELAVALRSAGVEPAGQRLAHLLLTAELDGLLISGPRRDRQFTYLLRSERVPAGMSGRFDRGEARAELARRFFASRGPAQLKDFAWWSGLTAADAKAAIREAGAALAHEVIDGTDHWLDPTLHDVFHGEPLHGAARPGPVAHLLPNFDEYTVAYRDRSAIVDPGRPFDATVFSFGSVLANVLLIDGLVRGSWRRTIRGDAVRVELRLLGPLSRPESAAVDGAVVRMGQFLEREVALPTDVRPRS